MCRGIEVTIEAYRLIDREDIILSKGMTKPKLGDLDKQLKRKPADKIDADPIPLWTKSDSLSSIVIDQRRRRREKDGFDDVIATIEPIWSRQDNRIREVPPPTNHPMDRSVD